jgi:hypothetical protein
MQQQKLQWGPLCPRQHCPTAWKNAFRLLFKFTPRNEHIKLHCEASQLTEY